MTTRPQRAPPGLLGLLLPLLLAVAWEAAVHLGYAQGHLMPPPSRLAATAPAAARSGELAINVAATMRRVFIGFAAGAVAGTLCGMLTPDAPAARPLLPGSPRHPLQPAECLTLRSFAGRLVSL